MNETHRHAPHVGMQQRISTKKTFDAATTSHKKGHLKEAEKLYRLVLTSSRDHFDSLHNLGLVLLQQRRFEDAALWLRKAIYCRPNSASAHANLGTAFIGLGLNEEAIAHFHKAVVLDNGLSDIRKNFATLLIGMRRLDEAVAQCDMALAAHPDDSDLHMTTGNVLQTIGRISEAQRHYERAIALSPRSGGPYIAVARCKRFSAKDPLIPIMEGLVQNEASIPAADRVLLHFALGKAHADLGNFGWSFRHMIAANALARQEVVYDETGHLQEMENIRVTCTDEMIRHNSHAGFPSDLPVFIVGMPRSGTTLIEQILASHRGVFGAGEIPEFEAGLHAVTGRGFVSAEAVRALNPKKFFEIGSSYIDRVRGRALDVTRITDKMPGNFRFVGLIHLALPQARIIHIRRDPLDTCLSIFGIRFTGNIPFAYDLGELGRYDRAYLSLMEHWRRVLPEGVMLEVQYEELVGNLEREARRIVAYCGLNWDPSCLEFYKTQRAVHTASAAQVRQPIYTSSVGRAAAYREYLAPLIAALEGKD